MLKFPPPKKTGLFAILLGHLIFGWIMDSDQLVYVLISVLLGQ